MYRLFLLIILMISFNHCKRNPAGIETNMFPHLDSSVIMYCNLNNEPYYGKYHYVAKNPSRSDDFYTVLHSYFPSENMEIILNNLMQYDQRYQFNKTKILTDSMPYYLTHEQPYAFKTDIKTDSLIIGSFFGVFVNNTYSDTLKVSDGRFKIYPHLGNYEFYIWINNRSYTTYLGAEYFERNSHTIMTVDKSFQDTLTVYFLMNLYTFSDSFVKEFNVWQNYKSVFSRISLISKVSDFRSEYNIQSGSVNVTDIDYYEHDGEMLERIGCAKFNFEAINNKNEIIKIENGNFSITGY